MPLFVKPDAGIDADTDADPDADPVAISDGAAEVPFSITGDKMGAEEEEEPASAPSALASGSEAVENKAALEEGKELPVPPPVP